MSLGGLSIAPVAKDGLKRALDGSPLNGLGSSQSSTCTDSLLAEVIERLNAVARIPLLAPNSEILREQEWPDPEKVDELKVEFCPIIRSRTNEEKSIQ
jgi:hypothetical protein